MSKHTPGPWRIEPHYKCGWKGTAKDPTPNRWQAIYVSGQERGAKGIVVNIGIKGGEVDDYWLSIKEADARLIEAAPDMLEALKALLPEVDAEIEQRQTSGSDEYWLGLKALSDTARAAIAKAEGLS